MEDRKNRIAGMIGTVIFHLLVLLFLWAFGFTRIIPQKEDGVEVMFGNIDEASGTFTPNPIIPEQLYSQPQVSPSLPSQDRSTPSLTQESEESVALQEQKKKNEKERNQELQKQAEERAKVEVERARVAEEQRRVTEINKKTSGAFGKGTQTHSSGNAISGKGFQGNPNGNSTTGVLSGVGGMGDKPSYTLKGRSSVGVLPRPSYSDQVEGVIVVEIVVSPQGKVVTADIDISETTISSRSMREAARKAAIQAHFSSIDSNENQIGSITYVYRFSK